MATQVSQYKNYYYSGAQAEIYFNGDVFIDEIHNLRFSTVTNKSPIYGYASELFDVVARGNLIVQGEFTINFVQANYLNIISAAMLDKIGGLTETNPVKLRFDDLATKDEFTIQQAINQIRGLGNQEFRAYAQQVAKGNPAIFNRKFYNIPSFDIVALFGDVDDPNANHTVRTIKDVHLTGQSQVIMSNGDPIMESYSWIGRDIE